MVEISKEEIQDAYVWLVRHVDGQTDKNYLLKLQSWFLNKLK